MIEFMIFAVIVGGAGWAFKQWLAYRERQQFMQRLDNHPRDTTGRIIDVTEAHQMYALSQPLGPVKPAGMNKWLVMGLCALYIVFPLDILPDFIPVLGWGDDLVAALIGIKQFFK